MAVEKLNKDLSSQLNITEDEDKLIIALDFGTTYSGISYVFTGDHEKATPYSIQEWPGARGKKWPKVPTILRYGKEEEKLKWGYELDEFDTHKVEGIKLLLDPDQPRPLYLAVSDVQAELERLPKEPIDIAADYIEALYKHSMAVISGKWPEGFLSLLQKKFVLTVPAVWSDKAKDSTLRAARKAGIHSVEVIKEPEAAALYTLHDLQNKALKVRDAFVLCDAGGGTVDLISYEIASLDPFQLMELVPGTGGLAGSLMLNKKFEEIIESAVGKEQFIKLRETEVYRTALRQFDESIKPGFNPFDDPEGKRKHFVNFNNAGLKDDPKNSISGNSYTLTHSTLMKIFQPIIDNVLQLVKDQVSCVKIRRMESGVPNPSEIKAIFLVGGFGSSIYLRESLQQAHPKIQVIQPHDAWSAIVKGAILSQLRGAVLPEVVATMATRHYGVSALFDPQIADGAQPKVWNAYEQTEKVEKMRWYIMAGDDLQRDQEIRFSFCRQFAKDYMPANLVFEDELIQSDAIAPPTYPGATSTKINCTMVTDLSKVPKSEFKLRTGKNGREYYRIDYDLVITLKTAVMKFTSEIDGEEMGSIEAKYA